MWFDALLHARSLGPRDLADLRFFGVAGALVPSDDAVGRAGAAGVRRGWEEVILAVRRLRRAGLAAYAGVGLHPRRIPARGLEALLADLPAALGRPEVAVLGAVGLSDGSALEAQVLARQLELARELRRPVLVAVPPGRERLLRRLLAALQDAALEPGQALVAGVDARAVRAVRELGHHAGLLLSGDGSAGIDAAVRLVRTLGPDRLVLASDAGLSGADPLALPRAADRLARAGLSDAVIRRVCGGNAIAFLGVEKPVPRGLRRAR